MWFIQAFGTGLAITLGVEVALGLCIALKHVSKGDKK
jgi:hypothetical protein